jgi:hypothetical protein
MRQYQAHAHTWLYFTHGRKTRLHFVCDRFYIATARRHDNVRSDPNGYQELYHLKKAWLSAKNAVARTSFSIFPYKLKLFPVVLALDSIDFTPWSVFPSERDSRTMGRSDVPLALASTSN